MDVLSDHIASREVLPGEPFSHVMYREGGRRRYFYVPASQLRSFQRLCAISPQPSGQPKLVFVGRGSTPNSVGTFFDRTVRYTGNSAHRIPAADALSAYNAAATSPISAMKLARCVVRGLGWDKIKTGGRVLFTGVRWLSEMES